MGVPLLEDGTGYHG